MTTVPLTESEVVFLNRAELAASAGGCPWPEFAACEAALESGFGTSTLAREDNNLFGMKQHKHPLYGTASLPTEEAIHLSSGEVKWVRVSADWVKYPSWSDCFTDRMSTLRRLASAYQHYAAALAAQDGSTFIREVSQTWSTDPNRGQKVLNIYSRWKIQQQRVAAKEAKA